MRLLLQTGVVLGATYLALVSLAWLFQRRLIYVPIDQRVPPVQRILRDAEEVSFASADGVRLAGWFVSGRGTAPTATVIFCNGNAGNRSTRAVFAEALSARGISVLLFDYRGYGGNPGSPSEAGLIDDLRGAFRYVVGERGVVAGKVVMFGESLGAAVALAVALDEEPAGLVLRSPFLSMTAVAKLHYPYLPVARLLQDRFPSLERISQVYCPVLVLAGEADRIVPAEQSRALYEAAASTDKRFVLFRGADHNSPVFLEGEEMLREVVEFVVRVVSDEG